MATSTATTPRVSTWEFDPAHSAAHFSIRHMMVSTVRGQFGKIAGVVKLDETDPTRSSVQATVDVSSISTRYPQRDAHLRSADFFDAEKFPTIDFKSTAIVKTSADSGSTGIRCSKPAEFSWATTSSSRSTWSW